MTDKTAVEAMAEGIADTGLLEGDEARSAAQSALDALKASGFAVVPVEPTNGMLGDGWGETPIDWRGDWNDLCKVYRAMIAAGQGGE